jgi:hypothetical protein
VAATLENKKVDKLSYLAPLTFLFAGLMPEYVAPFFTGIGFILALKNRISNKIKPKFGDLGISILVYMAWMLVSCLWTSSVISSIASIGLWSLMFAGYYFFTETIETHEDVERLIFCATLCAGIAGAIGVGQMVLYHVSVEVSKYFNPFWRFIDFGVEKLVVFLPEFITSKMGSTTFHSFATRACGTYSNPLFFATIQVMLFPFAAHTFLCSEDKKRKLIGLICFAASLGGVACSYSRGPYLYACIIFAVLLFYGGKKTLKLLGIGGVTAGGILVVFNGTVKRILSLLNDKDISVNTRKGLYSAIFEMIEDKPIFGYGTGFDNVRQMLHNTYNIKQPHAHNIFLEAWVEHGIIGPVLLAGILVVFLINIIRLAKCGKKQRELGVTLFASVAGFVLCGITDCLFYGLKPLQYFMMVLGLSQAVFAIYLKKKK